MTPGERILLKKLNIIFEPIVSKIITFVCPLRFRHNPAPLQLRHTHSKNNRFII